jgi:hypothetical protein
MLPPPPCGGADDDWVTLMLPPSVWDREVVF